MNRIIRKCIEKKGDYIEKWRCSHVCNINKFFLKNKMRKLFEVPSYILDVTRGYFLSGFSIKLYKQSFYPPPQPHLLLNPSWPVLWYIIPRSILSSLPSVFQCGSQEKIYSHKKFSLFTPWRHIGRADLCLHPFLTLALDGYERSTSHSGHITSGKEMRDLLDRRLDVPQGQSGRFWKRQKTSGQIDVIVSVLKLNDTTLVCTAYGYTKRPCR